MTSFSRRWDNRHESDLGHQDPSRAEKYEHPTSNIERRTSNQRAQTTGVELLFSSVQRSMFSVGCSMFAFPLEASPSSNRLRPYQCGLRRFCSREAMKAAKEDHKASITFACRKIRTSNIQHRTPNIEPKSANDRSGAPLLFGSTLDVQRWMFDVRLPS